MLIGSLELESDRLPAQVMAEYASTEIGDMIIVAQANIIMRNGIFWRALYRVMMFLSITLFVKKAISARPFVLDVEIEYVVMSKKEDKDEAGGVKG